MAKACKILAWISIGMLPACSTNYDEVVPDTELSVTVKNTSGDLLDDASVYVFDDLQAFTQTAASGIPTGHIATGQTKQGIVSLPAIPWDKLLYVYCAYKDYTIFSNTFITLDNSDDNYALKNPLERGSETSLQIVLKPADGLVTFWTADADSTAIPINVFLGSNPSGSLAQTSTMAPGPFQLNGLTVRSRKGNIPIEGKSFAGCLWTGNVTVVAAQHTTFQFADCVVGTVAFYTDNTNVSKLPITVTLNANDVIQGVSATLATTPVDCSASNLAIAYRIPGNYTYQAISTSGACVWSNSFSLAANECKLIFLPTCP